MDRMYKGAVIAIGVTTVLFVWALIYEAIKAGRVERTARELPDTVAGGDVQRMADDFSQFKTGSFEDGREMVLIPAGAFTWGSGPEGDFDETPQREILLDEYYIDKYEVTQADYEKFLKANKDWPKPFVPFFEDNPDLLKGPSLPVVGVTWEDANRYCTWVGKRIPTEAEWEKAARGRDGRYYPWGDDFSTKFANGEGEKDGFKYLAPVGSFEEGRSAYGIYDMAGNVSEWVSDWYDEFYYKTADFRNPSGPPDPPAGRPKLKVVRGGSYNDPPRNLRAAKRFSASALRADSTIGIRCAKDAKEDQQKQKSS